MRHKFTLGGVIAAVAAACLALWLFGNDAIDDFGLNAFTETLGILFTVLIVDAIIQRRDELRLLPQKATAYEDVRLLTSRMVSFWVDTYRASVPEASPPSVEEMFSEASFNKIRLGLNLDTKPNVIPERTWWEWVPQNLTEHRKMADTILDRHNNILDPEIYSDVHQIATGGIDPSMMNTIRQTDRESGFPRPHILGSYYFLDEGYCESVARLYRWCERQESILTKNGVKGLKKVAAMAQWEANDSPPCRMDEATLARAVAAVDEFRARHSAEAAQQVQ